ncbi:MAG: ROK family glucokinase [Christensenellaceae bacterium]|jgi:glucokinase|nr:ROK family glucokinase [Christensenellaceae bacterium]
MIYIGVDLGGTNIAVGLVSESGTILRKGETPTLLERGPIPIIQDMGRLALKLLEDVGLTVDDVRAVGVGVPGVVNSETGAIAFCPNLRWHNVDLIPILQEIIEKPIYIENDGTVAGLAESVAGASKGVKNSIFLTLGTGIGGGIVIDRKIYSGTHHVGSELGHMVIKFDGRECGCGFRGCWEQYASATALIRMGREAATAQPNSAILRLAGGDLEKIEAKTVIDAAREGDPEALAVYDEYIGYLAIGILNLINSFDPEIICLGGGLSRAGEFLLNPLREKLKPMIFYKDLPYASIKLATLGNDAGIIGAAMLGR